jgi:hypothetical protein
MRSSREHRGRLYSDQGFCSSPVQPRGLAFNQRPSLSTRCVSSSRCQTRRRHAFSHEAHRPDPGASLRKPASRLQTDRLHLIPFGSARQFPGGARRDRTDDLMLAKHALSQLSYGPEGSEWGVANGEWPSIRYSPFTIRFSPNLVGLGGLEPPTSRLSSARSNQLSYKPGSENERSEPANRQVQYRLVCRPRLSSVVRN